MKRRTVLGFLGGGIGGAALPSQSLAPDVSAGCQGQYVDARSFGAKADGVSDDWAALQTAIDACSTSGRTLYLRAGRYRVSKGLTVRYANADGWIAGFRILGDAPGLSLESDGLVGAVLAPSEDLKGAVLTIAGNPSTDNSNRGQISGLVVENIGINGGGRSVDGIVISYVTNLTLRNVHIGFCRNGLVFSRQANGRSFGYGHAISVERFYAVANSGWGVLSVGSGAMSCVFIDPNFTENRSGGMKFCGCPLVVLGGGFFGNYGPAVYHSRASEQTDTFGPVFYGTRFESNGRLTSRCSVILDRPVSSSFDACYFLCSTFGEHGVLIFSRNDENLSISLSGVRFSGSRDLEQRALVCDKRTIPFGLSSCTFSEYSAPVLVSKEKITDIRQLDRIGSLLCDELTERAMDGIRIGRFFLAASDLGLKTHRLF